MEAAIGPCCSNRSHPTAVWDAVRLAMDTPRARPDAVLAMQEHMSSSAAKGGGSSGKVQGGGGPGKTGGGPGKKGSGPGKGGGGPGKNGGGLGKSKGKRQGERVGTLQKRVSSIVR